MSFVSLIIFFVLKYTLSEIKIATTTLFVCYIFSHSFTFNLSPYNWVSWDLHVVFFSNMTTLIIYYFAIHFVFVLRLVSFHSFPVFFWIVHSTFLLLFGSFYCFLSLSLSICFRENFLNLNTTDILDQIILWSGEPIMPPQTFSIIPSGQNHPIKHC